VHDLDGFYAVVGRLIREARERRGVTQEALATLVSLSRTSLTNIERGRQKVQLHTLCRLERVMNFSAVSDVV
jgi:transcriptional regulator with XRE-family HTH domain